MLAYSGATHRPYAPVHGLATLSAGDWSIIATRRTRLGGATLNGSEVPLGEASEAWELDVLDGATVVRTLSGTVLPLTYTAAMQTTDFGAPVAVGNFAARLYQINPTLSLRGTALAITG